MTKERKDIFIAGFALFAIFFGAGNLIFPPSLGLAAGKAWPLAALGFLLTDPVLPILGVIATSKVGGRAEDLGKRVSPLFAKILGAVCILVIGPLFAVPRTAATVYEIAVKPIMPSSPLLITSLIFFIVTYMLVINQSGVIDKIGKYLTPALLVILTVIIGACVINPIGDLVVPQPGNYFLKGFEEGYQTMDALGASLMAGIVLSDLIFRGYKDRKKQQHMTTRIGLVAAVLLAFIYGGLTYVGAAGSAIFSSDMSRVDLLLGLVNAIFGTVGTISIAIAVSLACLTTSIGLTATAANYFSGISNGKLSYKAVAIAVVICSFALSNFGVEGLISIAVPILCTVYPLIIVLILTTLFDEYMPNDHTYRGAVLGAFIVSLTMNLNSTFNILNGPMALIQKLPLYANGFPWIVPSIALGVLFMIYGKMTQKNLPREGQLGEDRTA